MNLINLFSIATAMAILISITSCGRPTESAAELADVTFGLYKEYDFVMHNDLTYNHYFVVVAEKKGNNSSVTIPTTLKQTWSWGGDPMSRPGCKEMIYKGNSFGDLGDRGRPGGPVFGQDNCPGETAHFSSLRADYELPVAELQSLRAELGPGKSLRIEVLGEISALPQWPTGEASHAGKWVSDSKVGVNFFHTGPGGYSAQSAESVVEYSRPQWQGDTIVRSFDIPLDNINFDVPAPIRPYFRVNASAVQVNRVKIRILRQY